MTVHSATPTPAGASRAPASSANDAATTAAWRSVVAWVVGALLLRTLLASLVPLLPDETYYWVWSRRLQGGYFDHPPGIALLIALGTALGGDTTAGVRLGPALAALVMHGAAVVSAWWLAGRGVAGARAAARIALLITVMPLATLGLVLATPDAALFATVMVALLAVERALAAPLRSGHSVGWWTLAGIGLGAAFVSKYTAVLLPFGLVVACLVHPALRRRFAEPGPWWASAVALSLFAPVAIWNARHDWISFRFQLGHGFNAVTRGTVLSRELELVGAQAGLASPILFVLLAAAVWLALRDGWRQRRTLGPSDVATRRFALAVIAVVPLAFFAVSAARRTVEANWPALMYPSAMLLLATETGTWSVSRWWRRGSWLAAGLLVIVAAQAWRPLLPLPPRRDPMARAHGWAALGAAVNHGRRDPFLEGTGDRWVAADRYQDASELSFHLAGQPDALSLNLGGRTNQYDLWPAAYELIRPGDGLIAVFDDTPSGDSLGVRVGQWFRESRRGASVPLLRGTGEVTRRRLWLYRIATDVPARPDTLPRLSPP